MIGINLIPESVLLAKRRRRRLRVWGLTILATATVGAFPIGVEMSRRHQVRLLTTQRGQVQSGIESTRVELNRVGLAIRTLEAQTARADALRAKRSWSGLLGTLSQSMPEEMWLLSVATDPAAPAPGDRDLTPQPRAAVRAGTPNNTDRQGPMVVTLEAPRTLALEGYALEYRNLYEFMSRLKLTGAFADVTLTRANDEPVFNANAVRFKILCHW